VQPSIVRVLLCSFLALGGCGGGDGGEEGVPDGGGSAADARPGPADAGGLVGARPYTLFVPSGYDDSVPTPFVLLLHGYSATGLVQNAYFGLSDSAETRTVLLAYPDGTPDSSQRLFWNATDACCNFDGIEVDDVAYLAAVIDDVKAHYNVDANRVYVVGHSNGGFMSHRLACDLSDRIAGIISLAGANWLDPASCEPEHPVNVVQVHGDADAVILYEGGDTGGGGYPSAAATVGEWAAENGCSGELSDTGTRADYDSAIAGDETRIERYDGCPGEGAVELWTMEGSSHVPSFVKPAWGDAIIDWFLAHPRQ
jgi:polyhydroxybutyrate depolymerase